MSANDTSANWFLLHLLRSRGRVSTRTTTTANDTSETSTVSGPREQSTTLTTACCVFVVVELVVLFVARIHTLPAAEPTVNDVNAQFIIINVGIWIKQSIISSIIKQLARTGTKRTMSKRQHHWQQRKEVVWCPRYELASHSIQTKIWKNESARAAKQFVQTNDGNNDCVADCRLLADGYAFSFLTHSKANDYAFKCNSFNFCSYPRWRRRRRRRVVRSLRSFGAGSRAAFIVEYFIR